MQVRDQLPQHERAGRVLVFLVLALRLVRRIGHLVDPPALGAADEEVLTGHAGGAQHKLDLEAESKALGDLNKSVNLLRVFTETDAKTPADAKSMGFVVYEGPGTAPELLPPVIDTHLGKKGSGKATVSAPETGSAKPDYDVETSLDGLTGWTALPGGRKTRKLAGVPGSKIWVHFATLRGTLRSEWSPPVLVTFP